MPGKVPTETIRLIGRARYSAGDWRRYLHIRIPGRPGPDPLDLPILIIAGTEDPVGGKTETIQGLITRYMKHGHRALEYRFYAGGRHEITSEAEKDTVHRDIGHWLTQVLDR
jgi:alpha-beta hydrolase superfamily lysophospholipase